MRTAKIAFSRLLGLLLATFCGVTAVVAQVPVRIMPLGDSITAGFIPPSTYAGGYRERLYTLLTAPTEGFAVDYVGTLNYPGAVAEGWVDGDHEGHGGFKIQDIRSQLPVWLKQVPDPDVILLKIGTNDFWSGENVPTTQDRLRSLIADLSALRPHARIVVASLIRRYDAIEATQAQFNASLPGIVAAQAALGRKVTYVNMHAAFGSDPADISADGVHPTASGHNKIGDIWLPAVKSVITPLGTTAPPAIASVSARSDLQQVTVTFSKPINDGDGNNPANFSLSGAVSISQASLDASKRVVTLTTGIQPAAKLHTLTVSGVRDRLASPNFITPASTATFTSRAFVDGSFEQNNPAWVKQGTVSVQDATLQRATDGQKIVVFSGAEGANDGVISQSIPTIPNQKYRLQFDMGIYTSITSSQSLQLTVRDGVGGGSGQILLSPPVASLNLVNTTGIPSTNWRILTYEFTAISSSTTVRFADASTVTSSVDLLLDDVRLEAVTNGAPVAMNDGGIGAPVLNVAANSGPSTPVAVLANDTDPDNDALTVTAAASPNGTVSIVGGQTLRFSPTPGFSGEATVTYTISDGKGGTSSATVWISVVIVGPFGNGSFENGNPVDFAIPANWDASGSVIGYSSKGFYVPAAGNGVWMVVFNAGNNERVNRLWQTFSTVVGQTYSVTFDAGLAAYEGQLPRMQVVGAEVSGEVSPIPAGPRSWEIFSEGPTATWSEKSFTFTAGSSATTLTFTVDITGNPGPGGEPTVLNNAEGVDLVLDDVRVTAVGGTNQAPIAGNDEFSTPAGTTLTVTAPGVLANDTDDGVSPLTAEVVSQSGLSGTLNFNANGSFTYTPANGFTGTGTFTYRASDGLLFSTVTTVEIGVTAVLPFANGSFENGTPVDFGAPQRWTAVNAVTYAEAPHYLPYTGNGDWMAVFNAGNDGPPNFPLISTLSQTFATAAGQTYSVTFDAGIAGLAGKKQTLQAAVGGINLFSQEFTSSGPTAAWSENFTFNFTATGPATTLTFTVDIRGPGGSTVLDSATQVDLVLDDVRIAEVSTVNQAPVAVVDSYSVQSGSTLTVALPGVLANDTDDNGPLTAVLVTGPDQGGTLTLNADGSFDYTSAIGFSGEEKFKYRAFDGLLSSAEMEVTFTVTPVGPFANGNFDAGPPIPFGTPQGWSATGAVVYRDESEFPVYIPSNANDDWVMVFNPNGDLPVSTLARTFTTVAGQIYTVRFDAGLAYGAAGKMQTLQAMVVGESSPPPTRFWDIGWQAGAPLWSEKSFNFTAGGTTATLTFTVDITGSGAAANVDLMLDDVRVSEFSVVNEAPIAVVDSYSTQAGTPLTVAAPGVLANDTDDNGPLTAVLVTGPGQGGTLTLNADGSFDYTSAIGFSGEEKFKYRAFDGLLSSAETEVTFTVTPVGPFANGNFDAGPPIPFGTPQGWTATGAVVYRDENEPPVYVPSNANDDWVAVFNPNGNLPVSTLSRTFTTVAGQIYTVRFDAGLAFGVAGKMQTLRAEVVGESSPPPTRSWDIAWQAGEPVWSEKSFNFTAGGTMATLTFTVDITGSGAAANVDLMLDDVRVSEFSVVNEAPIAVVDSYSVQSGSTLTVALPGVLANDTDDNGPLTAVLVTGPDQGGTLTLNADGSFTYTPANGFSGAEKFRYRASDGLLTSAEAEVTFNVIPVGSFANGNFDAGPPIPFGTPQGWSATGAVVYRDESEFPVYIPSNANDDWMMVFNPNGDLPVSTLSRTFTTVAGQVYTVRFDAGLAFGAAGKMQTLQAMVVGESSPPPTRFWDIGWQAGAPLWSEKSFNFTAGGTTATLTFTVDITGSGAAANVDLMLDDVRVSEFSVVNEAPIAVVDSYSTHAGTPLTVAAPGVLANDTDDGVGPLTAEIVNQSGLSGTLNFNANGSFAYTPAIGFSGTETFTYRVSDGLLFSAVAEVEIEVTAVLPFANGSFENGAPVNLGAPQSWTAVNAVTYAEAPHYLPYTGNGDWMAVFNAGNDGPPNFPLVSTLSQTFATAAGQTYSVTFDAGIAGLAGKKQTLQAAIGGSNLFSQEFTSNGPTAVWTENFSFNFTATGPATTLTFTVDIRGPGESTVLDSATQVDLVLDDVRIAEVSIVNQAPVALNDGSAGIPFLTIAEDSGPTTPIAVLANDSDPNSDPLTVTQASSLNGTVAINGGQTLTFNPTLNYNGTATISYTISDGQGGTSSAVVFVLVTPVNDPPVAVNEGSAVNPFLTVAEDFGASASINVLANDMDIELNPLTVSSAGSPNGSVTINPNQSLSFSPALNFNGPATISYTISDGKGGTANATVFISVTPVNDAPVANPQSVSVNEDGSIAITLTGSDVDGNSLTFAVITAAHGSVNLSGAVAIYTPEVNYSGPDGFTFTVSDGIVVSTPATVSITVNGLPGSDFNQWMAAHLLSAGVGVDSDGDSVSNAVEYVIGGDPKSHMDATMLPTISRVSATLGGNTVPADYLLFTYRRTDRSKNDPATAIKVEWNNGLSGTWANAVGSPGVVVIGENDGFAPGVDRIKVYLPLSLAAGGKFFTRLGVDISGTEPNE